MQSSALASMYAISSSTSSPLTTSSGDFGEVRRARFSTRRWLISPAAGELFDRDIVEVISEVTRPSKRNASRRAPLPVARQAQDHGPVAIPQAFGGDGVARVGVEDREQVGNRRRQLVVEHGREVLVLEVDGHGVAVELAVALEHSFSKRPAAGGPPVHVDDLSAEEDEAAGDVEDVGDRSPLLG